MTRPVRPLAHVPPLLPPPPPLHSHLLTIPASIPSLQFHTTSHHRKPPTNAPRPTAASQKSTRTTFDTTTNTLRWLSTTGLRFILQFYYTKSPVFWIPAGWTVSTPASLISLASRAVESARARR